MATKSLPSNETGTSVAQKQALAKRGFKRRGDAPLKWEAAMTVEGVFVKVTPRTGENSAILTVDNFESPPQRERYWAPTILANVLETDFVEGEKIIIVCLGKVVPVKKGENAWGFEVYGK
jgi:hypothetical protein